MFPLELVIDLWPVQPVAIYAIPLGDPITDPSGEPPTHRFGVKWDDDHDERVLGAALRLYYKHPDVFRQVLFLAERKGCLTVTLRGVPKAPISDVTMTALNDAANYGSVTDAWSLIDVTRKQSEFDQHIVALFLADAAQDYLDVLMGDLSSDAESAQVASSGPLSLKNKKKRSEPGNA